MTDSMKFGPEWLRNMSADSTSMNSVNVSGQITTHTGNFSSSSSGGGGDGTSVNNASNNNSTNASSLHNNINAANSGASRNTFPEFRYGREEMLLLFDRNLGIPEILPSYKNLFVERVQYPLALVPSTDEDMMQGSVPTASRPGWLQRSPVGFSAATRGTGRVGCMERGRMRGKSIYHPVFQRPNAMFDEEQRLPTIKTDRLWVERNGGAVGDPIMSGSSTIGVGGSIDADAWNGSTPVASPRREFGTHPRNVENWRRSRNEDGSGGDSNPGTFSADGGWRINPSGFQNSQTRWGRSTSWRDDDLTNNESSAIGGGSSGTVIAGASGPLMLRSNSTLSTTHSERTGHSGLSGKQSGTPGVMRSISVMSCGTRNSSSANIWPNNTTIGTISNMQGDSSTNDEMVLPEWAMETPSDIGGTFDASGAFHGAVDNLENLGNVVNKQQDNDIPGETSSKEKISSETDPPKKPSKVSDDSLRKLTRSDQNTSSFQESDGYQTSLSPSPSPPSKVKATLESSDFFEESDKWNQNSSTTPSQSAATDLSATEIVSEKDSKDHLENEYSKKSITNSSNNVQIYSTRSDSSEKKRSNSNTGDYADRMMKATDDMIEKLIMDDEDVKDDHLRTSVLSGGNKINPQNMYMNMQKSQSTDHPSTVSPALSGSTGSVGPPNMSLYNMSGLIIEPTHNIATLHQLQQQQMAAAAAAAIGLPPGPTPPHSMTSSSSSDLWLYRDPQAKVQGPFSALEMTEWYRAGYFNENLFVRRVCDVRFRPLGELIKLCNGQMPFNHSHLIPIDLNPTAITPPLPPVISTQPSAQTDFLIKTLSEHQQQQQHEKLKGNVTAAADSLSTALKSLINSVDISQVLNMHFRTLQDRFIHNQEIEIANELSKNECFRRLSSSEQESIIRQKLQTLGLPEYLTNLTGLSNSLAILNPNAGTQLYDTIAECTKKEQLFSNHQSQTQPQTPAQQQQRTNHHTSSSSAPYVNTDEYIMKTKKSSHDINSNDLLIDYNLRMFLNNVSDSVGIGGGGVIASNSHNHDFLNDSQLFNADTNSTSNDTSQSPMMQMWMNSLAANQTNSVTNQLSLMPNQKTTNVSNQWLNGPLVGIPSISGTMMGSPKPTPASMWDVATLEQHVQVQQKHQQHEQQVQQQMQQQTFDLHRHFTDTGKSLQNHNGYQDINKQSNKQEENRPEVQYQQNIINGFQKSHAVGTKASASDDNKYDLKSQSQQQPFVNDKSYSYLNNKRNGNNNNTNATKLTNKGKNENPVEQISKKSEEERRREQNEDKRRQKEERKRQQIEEERRRLLQAEEERRRQMQEEEKRQQQIQAQRRKALMTNTNNVPINYTNNNVNNIPSNAINIPGNQKSKEQRIHSSIAPWSAQTMATKSQGPGLAEIQKAERRERRADQQRQLEIQEKQLRALAATAEAQDTILKWNAAPVLVKSFAEIQAEEAKRLANEQMEIQRRKEHETQNNLISFSSNSNTVAGALNSPNIASIWSGNKIWGTSTSTTGFWEEPLKFHNKSLSASLSNSNNNNTSNISNLPAATIVTQSSNNSQQKSVNAQQQHQQHTSTMQPTAYKNIKKSQSVAIMQNTTAPLPTNTSGGPSSLKKPSNNMLTAKTTKPLKTDNNNLAAIGGAYNDNKKSTAKNNYATTKGDDYEAEFTNWCTKSLNNMNTKVDVPTFVSFLRDLESPYEVKDYIRMYLGESKEYMDFAKQFLERRSKYKNLQRAQNAHDDDLCKPAQALTPSVNESGENKGRQKKVKKNKMTKLDARILGFSVTAAEGRINVGDRDYGDAS